MALTDAEKKQLIDQFRNVGFEGFMEESVEEQVQEHAEILENELLNNDPVESASDEIVEETESTDTSEEAIEPENKIDDQSTVVEEEVDPDIEALFADAPTEIEEVDDDYDDDVADAFLDEQAAPKIGPRLKGRIREKKEEEIIPVPNNTLPESLSFMNLALTEERLSELVNNLGEEVVDEDAVGEDNKGEGSYLEEDQKKQSRLMSRVRQKKEEDIVPVPNDTLPESLSFFNLAVTEAKLNEIVNELGEIIEKDSPTSEDGNYLEEEQKKQSRLMSRVRQKKEEDVAPVPNNTLPENLSFINLAVTDERINELIDNLGEIIDDDVVVEGDKEEGSYLEEEQKKQSRLMSRVRQKKEEDVVPVPNNTLPKQLILKTSVSSKRVKQIINTLGEVEEEK